MTLTYMDKHCGVSSEQRTRAGRTGSSLVSSAKPPPLFLFYFSHPSKNEKVGLENLQTPSSLTFKYLYYDKLTEALSYFNGDGVK